VENLPRVLPKGVKAVVDLASWQRPAVFDWLQTQGGIAEAEMLRTFNCGVGMIVCVTPEDADSALAMLREAGEDAWILGRIEASEDQGENGGEDAPQVLYSVGSGHV
jgi:phosphoribosylformylglycinamidine cyclo-ligase